MALTTNRRETVTTYEAFRERRPLTTRGRVRDVALSALAGLDRVDRVPDDSVTFLVFHYLFDDNRDSFRQLLAGLAADFDFVTVTRAVEMIRSGRIAGRNLCFTCDDGFSNFREAATIVREFGGSACVFVCPQFVEAKDAAEVAYLNKDRLRGPPVSFLSWRELESLLSEGHEVGNHTLGHRNLGELPDDQVEDEIGTSAEIIRRELGTCEHFACPYGHPASFDDHALSFAFGTGHRSFFTTERGRYPAGTVVPVTEEGGLVLKRHHFEPFWPVSHSNYFIRKGR